MLQLLMPRRQVSSERGTQLFIYIVVPAYNEARKISGVIADLHNHGYRDIVVVDDHSTDNTAAIARRHDTIVVRHSKNKGQGGALRTGIRVALERGAKIIVTFDGDGQHRAKEIADLVAPVASGEVDVALGSRFLGKAVGIQKRKWVTLKVSIIVERLLLGIHLTDVHNGFRALSRHAAETIEITCDDMAHASEIVAEIHDHKLRYVEVPVTILYDEYVKHKGQSIFNSFRILRELLDMKRRRRESNYSTAG